MDTPTPKFELQHYGSPVLHTIAAHIALPTTATFTYGNAANTRHTATLAEIAAALVAYIEGHPTAVGMAACQLGYSAPLFVAKLTTHMAPVVCVNPSALDLSGAEAGTEGCLSVPGFSATILRARSIRALWYDLDGTEHQETLRGFDARIWQHELAHLHGRTIVTMCSIDDRKAGKAFIAAAQELAARSMATLSIDTARFQLATRTGRIQSKVPNHSNPPKHG